MRKNQLLIASTAFAALLLAGCSGTTTDPTTSAAPSASASVSALADANPNDQMFVVMMIPHHEQAIEMSDIILAKDDIDPAIVALATQIKDAQGPEIATMTTWLEGWGIPLTDASSDSMEGMDHGGSDGGMMSDEEMTALGAATGTDAERLFLEGMIEHHEGAVTMAETEIKGGKNQQVLDMAQAVIDGQTVEITLMQTMLAELS